MNTNRITFIDSLKGLTILLVVMGHITEKAIGLSDTPFNEFYASFHMPMFIFLSGLFAYKSFSQWNFAEVATFFKKKVLRIIVPFVTIGGDIFYSPIYKKDAIWKRASADIGFCSHCFTV